MGLEALQWDNLVRIAEEARARYVDFKRPLPGAACCGAVTEFIAERLCGQLGSEIFNRYVHSAHFKVADGRGHILIVVGGKKLDFGQTFEFGIKLDPSVYQFRDLHPELYRLNGQSVFNGDYPKIYVPGSVKEDTNFFPTIIDAVKMRVKGYKI
jgi:hypothetical protein